MTYKYEEIHCVSKQYENNIKKFLDHVEYYSNNKHLTYELYAKPAIPIPDITLKTFQFVLNLYRHIVFSLL